MKAFISSTKFSHDLLFAVHKKDTNLGATIIPKQRPYHWSHGDLVCKLFLFVSSFKYSSLSFWSVFTNLLSSLHLILTQWANPDLFFVYFWSFQTDIVTMFTTNKCEKCHVHPVYGAGIRTPQPSGHEPPPITTRPGLPPYTLFLWSQIYSFFLTLQVMHCLQFSSIFIYCPSVSQCLLMSSFHSLTDFIDNFFIDLNS